MTRALVSGSAGFMVSSLSDALLAESEVEVTVFDGFRAGWWESLATAGKHQISIRDATVKTIEWFHENPALVKSGNESREAGAR